MGVILRGGPITYRPAPLRAIALGAPIEGQRGTSTKRQIGRRLTSGHIAERKSLKNSGQNTFCQSSARPYTHEPAAKSASLRYRPPLRNRGKCRDGPKVALNSQHDRGPAHLSEADAPAR
ncbi:hypothetical protein FXB40_12450 [Bradyrhizobium rifense]|uniref:Uncharacterized protein n=1 Tax=Bradyrhizobium rifense TaxID=515499 RepID=A0A5D3KG90_9BRAD|nr:hypothetical protein FXB40_12450 [Bradyrhizobium rifense]